MWRSTFTCIKHVGGRTTEKTTMDVETNFSKRGIVIGVSLIIVEYILYRLLFSHYQGPEEHGGVPLKYDFYITFFLATVIMLAMVFRKDLKEEIIINSKQFNDFPRNIGYTLGLSIFSLGTFIVYGVVKARIFYELTIFPFIDNNLYVKTASSPFVLINQIAYPIVQTIIYQGFLLNGFTKQMGYHKATILTSLFCGYWFQNIIGGTIFNLFLNHVFKESKNIVYPMILSVAVNLLFSAGYMINPEMWYLNADMPHYNKELIMGLALTVIGIPIVIPVMQRIFSNNTNTNLVDGQPPDNQSA
jgi:membrane protease YdiL (CAAX protease family)